MNSASPSTDALENGTADNVRWEIPTVNTSSGEFSLLVRRGDDTSNEKIVLEVLQQAFTRSKFTILHKQSNRRSVSNK
jgi:hypothetical protein